MQVLGLAKERLAAAGVQLGRKVVLEGQEIIEYIAASEGQEDMVGRVRTIGVYIACTSVSCVCRATDDVGMLVGPSFRTHFLPLRLRGSRVLGFAF